MIITARQLQDLHQRHGGNGRLTLPYRARLTPLAADYIRARKIVLGYSDVTANDPGKDSPAGAPTNGAWGTPHGPTPAGPVSSNAANLGAAPADSTHTAPLLWWCDGPCGPAKAAVVQEERQSLLRAMDVPQDARHLITAVKLLAGEVKAGRAGGGLLLVQNGAAASVFANRCPSLRAILGTCLAAVESGIQQVAANVLIIEYPHHTLPQVRNMLSRFSRGPRRLGDQAAAQLQELSTCG